MSEQQYKPRTDVSSTNFVGRVTRTHYTKGNGKASVLRLTVACGEAVKRGEERVQETAWIPVVIFGNSADALANMIGDPTAEGAIKPRVAVQGRLRPGQGRNVTVDDGGAKFNLRELEVIAQPFGVQLLDYQNGDRPAPATGDAEQTSTSDEDVDF